MIHRAKQNVIKEQNKMSSNSNVFQSKVTRIKQLSVNNNCLMNIINERMKKCWMQNICKTTITNNNEQRQNILPTPNELYLAV